MKLLFIIPQEMFFVVLTALFLAAIVSDLRHSRFFRSRRNTPSPWKALSRDMRIFFLILVAFFTWAQSKTNMFLGLPSSGLLSGAALESIESSYCYSLPEEEAGIPYALRTGNPPYASNAVLTAQQFESGFACVAVAAIQPSALAAPSNAVAFTDWPYAVARRAALLPPGLLPGGFTFGGRPVTDLYMAASGMISFDGPKSSPFPATDGIPDGTPANYMAVLQTPSDIVPPGGVFWYAPGADSSLFTWKDVFLGQDTNCLATVQAELFADGGFTFRYSLPSAAESYAAVTNPVLIGAQNNAGGETVLFTDSLAAVHPSLLPAFELRWKSLDGLSPDVPDYDSDGLSDADELFIHHTDPRSPDTDGDGLLDGEEIANATDPLDPDENGDGIPDGTDLTGYSLSDTNLVFKLINNIAPSVDPNLDSDGDGWADWLELRFGTDTNYFYSTPEYSDALFSVTVSLAAPPPAPGVLSVGTNRVMVTGPGSWTFWRTSGEAHPVNFTAPRGATAPFAVTLGRPDAARYDKPSPDGRGGDFGKVALPLISFSPPAGRCCHEARTGGHCETYTACVSPPVPGTYDWEMYKPGWWNMTRMTNAAAAVSAGHDIEWIRLLFTPSGASACRESWAPVNTHCNAFTNTFAGAGGSHIIYANTDDDDGDGTVDNADAYVEDEDDLHPVTPYAPPRSCCPCPSHSPTNWTCGIEAVSGNLRVYGAPFKSLPRGPGFTLTPGETLYVEGLVSSATNGADYVDWRMEGLTEDGLGGFVATSIVIRSVYTVIDLKAAPVRLEPVTAATNAQGTVLNPCGVAVDGLAMYKVDVAPPGIVPDDAIHWSVASGDVDFYQGFDTGRTAIIRGGSTPDSDFKLEVAVDGLPPAYRPHIFGRVLEPRTVQVRAYVICDSNGVAAVSANTVTNWIAEANRIYRQVAMTFTLVSVQNVYGKNRWFEIDNSTEFQEMCSYTNYTGGLELYCVGIITWANGIHSDRRLAYGDPRRGMAVKAEAALETLAHEIGHAAGLSDMYEYDAGDGPVSEDKTRSDNWSGGAGTGYHAPSLAYRGLTYRVIMSAPQSNISRLDIPVDCLTGVIGTSRVPVSVGLKQMIPWELRH